MNCGSIYHIPSLHEIKCACAELLCNVKHLALGCLVLGRAIPISFWTVAMTQHSKWMNVAIISEGNLRKICLIKTKSLQIGVQAVGMLNLWYILLLQPQIFNRQLLQALCIYQAKITTCTTYCIVEVIYFCLSTKRKWICSTHCSNYFVPFIETESLNNNNNPILLFLRFQTLPKTLIKYLIIKCKHN